MDEQSSEAKLEIQAAEAAYRAGRGSQAEVLAAQGALALLLDMAAEVDGRIRMAQAALTRWVGEAGAGPLGDPPAIESLRMDAASLDGEVHHHPEIAVLARREDIAAADADIARAEKLTDWSVEVAYSQRGPAYSNMLSIGVSIPLQWNRGDRQERELAARLSLLEQARGERREAVRAHLGEVRAMLADWDSRRARLERYQRDILPLARERTRAALAAYRGAKATLQEVLMARRNEIEVRMQALQLERETARTWAQLTYLQPADGAPPGSSAGHRGEAGR